MRRLITSDWPGQIDWSAERESGAPVLRFTPAARPIDLLAEEAVVHRPTPSVHSIESFESREDVGRYLPLAGGGVPGPEAVSYLPTVAAFEPLLGSTIGTGLYDSALDAFFIGARVGHLHSHDPFGDESSELHPLESVSDEIMVRPATVAEDLDVFIPLPHGEVFVLPLDEGADAFSVQDRALTFGGGDDPLWMLTLLPTPDDHVHDTGFGHPGLGIDPWG